MRKGYSLIFLLLIIVSSLVVFPLASSADGSAIRGQYLDEDGKPLGGKVIIAEWIDEKNQFHSITATSLTKAEAIELGDDELEGYFTFDEGNINPKVGTFIEIKLGGDDEKIVSRNTVDTSNTLLQKDEVPIENEEPQPNGKINLSTFATQAIERVKEKGRLQNSFFVIIAILIIGTGAMMYKKQLRKKMHQLMEEYAVIHFHRQMKRLGKIKLKEVMTKRVLIVDKKDSVRNLISSILKNNIGALIVMDGKRALGIVTERDLFKKVDLLLKNDPKTKVENFLSAPLKSLSPDDSILDAMRFTVQHNIRKIPIMKGKKLVGIATHTDLGKVFDKIFSGLLISEEDIPIVKTVMTDKALLARKEENLLYVVKYMMKSKADAVIIINEEETETGEKAEVLGIITERDLLGEWYNNPERFAKLRVEEITNTKMFTVIPGSSLLEANKLMIEKNVRRLIVVLGNQPVAIIRQEDVVNTLYELYKKMTKNKIT